MEAQFKHHLRLNLPVQWGQTGKVCIIEDYPGITFRAVLDHEKLVLLDCKNTIKDTLKEFFEENLDTLKSDAEYSVNEIYGVYTSQKEFKAAGYEKVIWSSGIILQCIAVYEKEDKNPVYNFKGIKQVPTSNQGSTNMNMRWESPLIVAKWFDVEKLTKKLTELESDLPESHYKGRNWWGALILRENSSSKLASYSTIFAAETEKPIRDYYEGSFLDSLITIAASSTEETKWLKIIKEKGNESPREILQELTKSGLEEHKEKIQRIHEFLDDIIAVSIKGKAANFFRTH